MVGSVQALSLVRIDTQSLSIVPNGCREYATNDQPFCTLVPFAPPNSEKIGFSDEVLPHQTPYTKALPSKGLRTVGMQY